MIAPEFKAEAYGGGDKQGKELNALNLFDFF
jgi:hypothetical protein